MAGGLLHRPEVAHDTALGTGEVIDVGPGPWSNPEEPGEKPVRIPVGLEIGEGVVFTKFLANTRTNEQLRQWHLGPDVLIIKPNDVLLAYDRKNPPEFG